MPEDGYAGTILKVDLSSGSVTTVPTGLYSDLFVGGRGIATRIYWEEVPPALSPSDPENRLIFMTGPATGVPGFGGRFQVCGKSVSTGRFSTCNIGGSWGTHLKLTGYDGLVVSGKAASPIYLRIDGDSVEFRDASHLRGRNAFYAEAKIKEALCEPVWVLTVGPAGDNMVSFATFLASDDSTGAGGLAGVMGSKNLKAIAVKGSGKINVASKERVSETQSRIRALRADLPEAMVSMGMIPLSGKVKKSFCHGCPNGCLRASYRKPNGSERKFMCQAALFYETRARRYYGADTDVAIQATEICDDFGLDTRATETMIMWLSRCYQAGLLTEEQAGIPLSRIGSREFIEGFVGKISRREGFGDLLAYGSHKAAEKLGPDYQALLRDYITAKGDNAVYGPRLYITTGIFYALEPRFPIQQLHEVSVPSLLWLMNVSGIKEVFVTSRVLRDMAKRFYGSELAMDFSTYEGKALAAARIQDREFAKESLILCDLCWPLYFSKSNPDMVGDSSLESQVCSAITGKDVDEVELYRIGERLFNLQRAVLAREGHRGRECDRIEEFNFTTPLKNDFGNAECLVPGRNGEVLSRKGRVVERDKFEDLKDEFYRTRGWDVSTGLQTRSRLLDLGLEDVAAVLEAEHSVK